MIFLQTIINSLVSDTGQEKHKYSIASALGERDLVLHTKKKKKRGERDAQAPVLVNDIKKVS